ncbi:hypothetical protein Cgig2_000466 [Carnegiea gigantea]|uniref:Uncharacterized protein n=1 Tax=Carnegiea gigantea TaxID=171969 RepID=A0A9Q1K3D1_9CARY|nr:hypothetical protein Cgig2_000466 [Carnegiea gigantea]
MLTERFAILLHGRIRLLKRLQKVQVKGKVETELSLTLLSAWSRDKNFMSCLSVCGLHQILKFLLIQVFPTFCAVVTKQLSRVGLIAEKVLPINKRKSLYYVSQEEQDGNALVTNDVETTTCDTKKYGYAANCSRPEHPAIKMRRLKSIYEQTKPITIDLKDL